MTGLNTQRIPRWATQALVLIALVGIQWEACATAADESECRQLVEQLRSGGTEERHRAAVALGALGPAAGSAVPALRTALTDENYEVRWCAIDALGRLGEPAGAALDDLVGVLRSGADRDSRRLAARALGHLGNTAAAASPALVEALGSADHGERVEAALALCRIGRQEEGLAPLITLIADSDDLVAFSACLAIVEVGPAAEVAIEPLLAALVRDDADVRRAAARGLGSLGTVALAQLAERLKSSGADRDGGKADAADRVANGLIAAIGYAHRELRQQRLYRVDAQPADLPGAVELVERQSIPALGARLAASDADAAILITRAMAEAGLPAVASLATALAAGGPQAQAAAQALADMLDRMPDPAATDRFRASLSAAQPALAKALGGDAPVRRAAARALAELPIALAAETAAALRAAVQTDDAATRFYAARALSKLATPPAEPR